MVWGFPSLSSDVMNVSWYQRGWEMEEEGEVSRKKKKLVCHEMVAKRFCSPLINATFARDSSILRTTIRPNRTTIRIIGIGTDRRSVGHCCSFNSCPDSMRINKECSFPVRGVEPLIRIFKWTNPLQNL